MNSVKLNLPRKVWNYPANHEINFLLLLSLTVFWEWRVSKKLAANCLCTRLLASSCSLHQGHRQFFPSKVNSRVNFAVTWFCARNKHKEVKKMRKATNHMGTILVPQGLFHHYYILQSHMICHVYYEQWIPLPGRVLLQEERLCPDIVFSWRVRELGVPLSEVLRKQTFLFKEKWEREKKKVPLLY